jgi:hypothetical protein
VQSTNSSSKEQLIDSQAVQVKFTDRDVDLVSWIDDLAFIGEHHPVGLAVFGRGGLAKLSDFSHDGHVQARATLFIDQECVGLLFVLD